MCSNFSLQEPQICRFFRSREVFTAERSELCQLHIQKRFTKLIFPHLNGPAPLFRFSNILWMNLKKKTKGKRFVYFVVAILVIAEKVLWNISIF